MPDALRQVSGKAGIFAGLLYPKKIKLKTFNSDKPSCPPIPLLDKVS
jgi:hypothetical protein